MLSIDYQDNIAILKMDRGVTNALNLEFITGLDQAFQDIAENSNIHALVFASNNDKFFSIGFDIPQLFELSRQDFQDFYRRANQMFLDLFTLPIPTVAALTGHAIAGGCILALCCDYRLIAAGRKLMGLNEIKLGVPVPYLADLILQSLVGVRYSRHIVESGEFYESKELQQFGMVDQILPPDDVLPKAIQKALTLASMPTEAYRGIKRNRTEPIESQFRMRSKEKEALFVECWYAEAAKARLREAIKKF